MPWETHSACHAIEALLSSKVVKRMYSLAGCVRFRTQSRLSSHHGWCACREETNDGFCAICHDDYGDVHCKGGCRRSFHTACLPLRLPASSTSADAPPPPPPASDKSPGKEARPGRTRVRAVAQRSLAQEEADDGDDEGWKCMHCATKTAECAACGEVGARESEVWKCRMGRCGLFYHSDCARRLPQVRGRNPQHPSLIPPPLLAPHSVVVRSCRLEGSELSVLRLRCRTR
jgi:hypothetical protein